MLLVSVAVMSQSGVSDKCVVFTIVGVMQGAILLSASMLNANHESAGNPPIAVGRLSMATFVLSNCM